MAATRPGNPERGWNDPPMFLYSRDGQQKTGISSRKNPLTQRVGMPQSLASSDVPKAGGVESGLPTLFAPNAPPVSTRNSVPTFTPPTGSGGGGESTISSPARSDGVKGQGQGQSRLSGDICVTTVAALREVLKMCEEQLKPRAADDIRKKIEVLHAAWSGDKLSAEVQRRMAKLSRVLADRDYDQAHDVHLSLMVDYVSEVSQWMVGIKRLIAEARVLLPPPTSALEKEDVAADREPQTGNDRAAPDQTDETSAAASGGSRLSTSGGEFSQVDTEQSAVEEERNNKHTQERMNATSQPSDSDSWPETND